ncbi:MAG: hypothetical protein ABUL62_03025 [Myxococcales bacterium]
MLFNPAARFQMAHELRSPQGAAVGDLFSFVSGLYFRGKLAYARAFGHATPGQEPVHVITAGGGLCNPDERVTLARLQAWAAVSIHHDNPHFTAPLVRHASALRERFEPNARFVLLGSIASDKYVRPLSDALGPSLLFPVDFAGLGDMSRGALLLNSVRDKRELAYAPYAAR